MHLIMEVILVLVPTCCVRTPTLFQVGQTHCSNKLRYQLHISTQTSQYLSMTNRPRFPHITYFMIGSLRYLAQLIFFDRLSCYALHLCLGTQRGNLSRFQIAFEDKRVTEGDGAAISHKYRGAGRALGFWRNRAMGQAFHKCVAAFRYLLHTTAVVA